VTGKDEGADIAPIGNSPVVILVRPQLPDNIGAAARAMANGGLFHLRLVAPRDGWPQEAAWRNASGAQRILEQLTLHDSVADAVADLHHVYATCPRPRHIVKKLLTARGAALELRDIADRGLRAGLLFGPERAGLDNDDMAEADALVRYPLNPAFTSVNLAQAVMVMAYEWWQAGDETVPRVLMTNESDVAVKGELENFLVHLVDQLDACGFLRNAPKRPGMVRTLRHLFQRGEVTGVADFAWRGDGACHRPAGEGAGREGYGGGVIVTSNHPANVVPWRSSHDPRARQHPPSACAATTHRPSTNP
jgi:TrmH family RNA methyltransferase